MLSRPGYATPPVRHPVYPPGLTDAAKLQAACSSLLAMDTKALLALVPPQAGFWFSDCPGGTKGAQEHQLVWTPALGDQVKYAYGDALFPSAQYPENGQISVRTPTGRQQIWKYYQAPDGKRYWFEARRWYEQRVFTEYACYALAQLYAVTRNPEAGRRAALILARFADVYPDYIVHFDYPYQPKQFFTDGVPANFEPYRAAKWSWWAYSDISIPLLKSYDLLADSGYLTPADRRHVEKDLLHAMVAFVSQYDSAPSSNMSPSLWTSMAVAANVLGDDVLADRVVARIRQMVATQFTDDGMWREGAPAYHQQTVKALHEAMLALYPGQTPAQLNQSIAAKLPELQRALNAAAALRLPDNRLTPLHDTWSTGVYPTGDDVGPLTESRPVLMPGLGYAILGMGVGPAQFQAHLNFSGRYGHAHYDSLSLLLYANGKELYSDIGYTHSLARPWTLSTASHNTVVIDEKSQSPGSPGDKCLGTLRMFEATDPTFQVVESEAPNAYPGIAKTYRRCLIAVDAGNGVRYVVDVFDVAGGTTHDWMLHGSADEAQTLTVTDGDGVALASVPEKSLLPADFAFKMPVSEADSYLAQQGPWAYGVFHDILTATTDGTFAATFRCTSDPAIGVRTFLLGAPGTQVKTAAAWAVRGIGLPTHEDETLLPRFQRQSLIVRRTGSGSAGGDRFVAVHCPFNGTIPIRSVTELPLKPAGIALKIERDGGTDYVILGAGGERIRGRDGSNTIATDARVALILTTPDGVRLKMIDGTSLAFNARTLHGVGRLQAAVLGVEGRTLTIAGAFPAHPNDVVLLQHGNGATTAFHIASAKSDSDRTTLVTEELSTLTAGAPNGSLTLSSFPQTVFPAPHEALLDTFAADPPISTLSQPKEKLTK